MAEEGEDIQVRELGFDDALAGTTDGRIVDAKEIMLLQWAALAGPFAATGQTRPAAHPRSLASMSPTTSRTSTSV
jgi:hypothetical protein